MVPIYSTINCLNYFMLFCLLMTQSHSNRFAEAKAEGFRPISGSLLPYRMTTPAQTNTKTP